MPSPSVWRGVVSAGAGLAVAGALAYTLHKAHLHYKERPLTSEEWNTALSSSREFAKALKELSVRGLCDSGRESAWPVLLEVLTRGQNLRNEMEGPRRQYDELIKKVKAWVKSTGPTQSSNGKNEEVTERDSFMQARSKIIMDAVRTPFPETFWQSGESTQDLEQDVQDQFQASNLDSEFQIPAKRLIDLLSAYAIHDQDIGYCQGMSDLALPFVDVFHDQAIAYICFQAFLFAEYDASHQAEVSQGWLRNWVARFAPVLYQHLQKIRCEECFFAHRMLLVSFRRDLPYNEALRVWEMSWAKRLISQSGEKSEKRSLVATQESKIQPSLFIYVITAAILRQGNRILQARDVDDVLKIFVLQKLRLQPMLRLAHSLMQRDSS